MPYSDAPANLAGLEEDVHVETAVDFLAYLSAQHERWAPNRGSRAGWVFRGQREAQWALRSTLLRRRNALLMLGAEPVADGVQSLNDTLRGTLRAFEEGLHDAGLPIPHWPPRSGTPVWEGHYFAFTEIPLMALARHHGIPTLLLDWTTRAYVAAYFSVVEFVKKPAVVPRVAVWAFEVTATSYGEHGRLRIQWAPGSTNANMRAQSGLFMLLEPVADDPCRSSIDGFVATERTRGATLPRLRRVTMPAAEAPELLRRLDLEGINGATMFPGVDGVVRGMREAAWSRWSVQGEEG